MLFTELKTLLEEHREDYYLILLDNSSTILNEVGRRTKKEVAHDLHLEAPLFSTVYRLILAHDHIKNR